MIYLDTAYLAKCYLTEHGSAEIRTFVTRHPSVVCSAWGRLELTSVFHRHFREGRLTAPHLKLVLRQLESDNKAGVWLWADLTPDILDEASSAIAGLPSSCFIRAGDAIHLTTANREGASAVYTSDRHMLAAAPHFGLKGIDLLAAP